jgi:predicted nucleic acid-binding protein
MILTQDNEYAAVLDACVIVPMPLCDTLLRLAEDPAMYRPLWSETILREAGDALEAKLKLTPEQRKRRICAMTKAWPEATVNIPSDISCSLDGIPDERDKHVLAAAICGHANAIVTQNVKHFPQTYIEGFGILCQTPDDFLVHQFYLGPAQVLEKLDAQAIGINKSRPEIINKLRKMVPKFIALVDRWAG